MFSAFNYPLQATGPIADYVLQHGDGVKDIAFHVNFFRGNPDSMVRGIALLGELLSELA